MNLAGAVLGSHRFSTFLSAGRTFIFDHSEIVEERTHADLMGTGGRYTRMFLAQAESLG